MREVSERFLSAVQGSNKPVVTANIWLGPDVIREDVYIAGGQVSFDGGRIVEGALTLSFAEDDPEELKRQVDAYGCRVNIRAGFDLEGSTETVSMGWYEIREATISESWSWPDWAPEGIKGTSVVTLRSDDLMSVVAESDFLTPTQPTAGADAWGAISDLCLGVVSVIDPGYSAKTIPAGLVFDYSRIDAIKAIAKLWDAYPVMTPDGQLTLATDDGGDTAPDFGVRVNIGKWQRESSSRGLKNAVTFIGKTPEGTELVGYALEDSGPLRYGGEFGRRPKRQASDLMATQSMVDQAARTALQTMIANRSTTQTVSALWNPAIELRDKTNLILPDKTVAAKITGYTLPLLGGEMSVTLRLPLWS